VPIGIADYPHENFPGTGRDQMPMRLHISTLLFLALSASALFMLRAEVSVFTSVSPTRPHPHSLKAFHARLMVCDRAMSLPLARLQPERQQMIEARRCGDLAKDVLADVPTHGFAHLIAARAAGVFRDDVAQLDHLRLSVAFAPFEGWIAERRFVLAANSAGFGEATLRADAATLLTTQSGAEMLSRYFFRRPGLREMITSTVDRAGQGEQQRFLNLMANIKNAR
jgi:hypothetical protein